jgi:hypothetical protein
VATGVQHTYITMCGEYEIPSAVGSFTSSIEVLYISSLSIPFGY